MRRGSKGAYFERNSGLMEGGARIKNVSRYFFESEFVLGESFDGQDIDISMERAVAAGAPEVILKTTASGRLQERANGFRKGALEWRPRNL